MENLDLGINLGFGTVESVDELTEKLKGIETTVENINEVSNNAMFTNALNTIMEMKKDLKDLEESIKKNGKGGNGSNAEVVNNNKKQSFDLSQEMKNILNYLKTIATNTNSRYRPDGRKPNSSNGGSSKPKLNETQELINSQLKDYYRGQGRFYNDKKWVNDSKITPMTSKQFEEGFSKLVKNLSKEVAETLNRNLQKSMVNNGTVDYFNKNKGNVTSEEELHRLYKEISQMVKTSGFNGNVLKYNPLFKKEYNDFKEQFNSDRTKAIRNNERLNKVYGMGKNVNYDEMSSSEIKRMLNEQSKILSIISSKQFKDFKSDKTNTSDKYYEYVNTTLERQNQLNQIKSKGTSFSETLNNNMGLVVGGTELLGHLGQITNFFTSKEFERSMGALSIVGNLGNQLATNESKYTIQRDSNSVNADITEFSDNVREVIKTGKSYEQSMNLVKQAGKIAVASFEDLTTATDILNSRFTALDLSATDKNLNEFANRLQSALDNTALDLGDIQYAGKQTNTAMNALINSAEEKGIQGRSIEDYTKSVSNIELALVSELKQQGKSGEQAGIVIRTLFTKLMTADGVGGRMLDNDLAKMTKEEREKVGFSNVSEMRDLVMGGEVEKVLNGLSELQKEGNLSYLTLKKLFTERHSSAILTLLTKVNGDINTFVDKITTGIDVSKRFGKAMDNWAIKVERIGKNLKTIATNTFTGGATGIALGGGVTFVDGATDLLAKGMSSDNVLTRSISQSLPQAFTSSMLFKGIYGNMQGRAVNKIDTSFDNAINRISNLKGIKNKAKVLNRLEEMRGEALSKVVDSKGLDKFNATLMTSRTNVSQLSNDLVNMGKEGKVGMMELTETTLTFGGALKGLMATMTPMLIIAGITTVINLISNQLQKAEKLRQDANNLDKHIIDTSELGNSIVEIEKNINNIFDPKQYEDTEKNGYIQNVRKMIESNELLKASIDNINAIKSNPFKSLTQIRQELFEEKTKNTIGDNKDLNNIQKFSVGRSSFDPISVFAGVFSNTNYASGNQRGSLQWLDPFDTTNNRNMMVKYRGNQFSKSQVITEQDISKFNKLNNLDKVDRADEFARKYYAGGTEKYYKATDKKLDNLYKNIDKEFTNSLHGIDRKSVSKEDMDKFFLSKTKLSDDIIKDVFGEDIAKKIGGKGVNNTDEFYKLISELGKGDLQKGYKEFMTLITSGQIDPKTVNLLSQYGDFQMSIIKESDETLLKQLERNKESLEQSKAMLESYKQKLVSMYEKTGLPAIAYGKILEEEKNNGKLLTLSQGELDKYNSTYNKDINSIPLEMSMNNSDGVKEYQASMFAYYQKRAVLDKQIQDTQKQLEEAKKSGNMQEEKQAQDKLNYMKKDVEFLDKSKDMARKVLNMSNFSAKKFEELLSMSTELAKAQSTLNNLVGSSFGNKGSQLQQQYDSLMASRNLFNKIGKMNLDNQVNSAYIEDKGGATLKKLTGKSDYSSINMDDYTSVMNRLKNYRKNNINEKDGISVETLQSQLTMYSSIISERIQIQQQEVQLAQQQKQIQIDIVKYWLKENELKTQFTESAEYNESNYKIKSAGTNYRLRYGKSEIGSIEELQRVTNMRLENSNLKMKDQLDYAKRQIMVAKENSMREINAIRRLEGKNTTNAQKSDTNAKNNTVSTNNTIITSANNISTNLNNAMQQIMTAIQSMQMNYSTEDGGYESGSLNGGLANAPVFDFSSLPNIKGSGYNNVLPLAQAVSSRLNGLVSTDQLMKIFYLESGWKQGDVTGSYRGLGQWSHGEWGEWVRMLGGQKYGLNRSNPDDPRANALMTALMVLHNTDQLKKHGHSVVTPEDIHLSHLYTSYIYGNYNDNSKLKDIKGVTNGMIISNPSITNRDLNMTVGGAKRNIANIYARASRGKSSSGGVANSNYIMTGTTNNTKSSNGWVSGAGKLKVKSAESYGGGAITKDTYDFALLVQQTLGSDFKYFSALNDRYHKNHSPSSEHTKGVKFDLVLNNGSVSNSKAKEELLYQIARSNGYSIKVLNEYIKPSGKATGGHLDVKVNGRSYSGGMSTQPLQLQTMTIPKAYVPRIDKNYQAELNKITQNESYKGLIKTEKDEAFINNNIRALIRGLNGKTFTDGIKDVINLKNKLNEITVGDETYDGSNAILEAIMQNLETKREIGNDSYDKMSSEYVDIINDVTFSFEELKAMVEATTQEYSKSMNFLNRLSYDSIFTDFTNKIEEVSVKIKQFNDKLSVDSSFNTGTREALVGLFERFNIRVEGNELENASDFQRFMTNSDQILQVVDYLETKIPEVLAKNFDTLEFDKATLSRMSANEVQQIQDKVVTTLGSEDTPEKNKIFANMDELKRLIETLKIMKQQIEKTNDLRKLEIDLMRENAKYLSEYTKNIMSSINELSILDGSKTRNLRTLRAENNLISRGVALDSKYGKKYLENIERKNKQDEYTENINNINRLVKFDSNSRNVLKMYGYSNEMLDNLNLNDRGSLDKLTDIFIKYQENSSEVVGKRVDEILTEFGVKSELKDIDLTDISNVKKLNAELLATKTGKDQESMKALIKELTIAGNSTQNINEIVELLIKAQTSFKNAFEDNTKIYQDLYKQGLTLLSDMLFGEGDFKGLGKEQYTQALDSLLQLGIANYDNIKSTFKQWFGKDKKEVPKEVPIDNSILANKTNSDKTSLSQTLEKSSMILSKAMTINDKLLTVGNDSSLLMVSADKSALILPKGLKQQDKQELPNISDTLKDYKMFGDNKTNRVWGTYVPKARRFYDDTANNPHIISDNPQVIESLDNSKLRQQIIDNNTNEKVLSEEEIKKIKSDKRFNITNYAMSGLVVIDGMLKKELQYKKKQLEIQEKILEMNLQMAETTEERRRIEEQILQNKLSQVDTEYRTNSSFLGGMFKGSTGFGLQGAISGAMQGSTFGPIGTLVGGGLGFVGGILGGTQAKIQAEQQKAQLIAQQKLQWLAEDRNKYLKTMASAMSEQAKWTTKIGVNDAISRSVRAVISSTDTIGGTAYDTRTVQNKKKKGGGLLGSKKYDTVQSFTASYNTNDSMFGGRKFDDKTDLDFAYGVLANRILGDKLLSKVSVGNTGNLNIANSPLLNLVGRFLGNDPNAIDPYNKIINFALRRKSNNNPFTQQQYTMQYEGSLKQYIDKKVATSGMELNSDQFLKAWNGQATLQGMGMLQDTSRDWEVSNLIQAMKSQYQSMGASQDKVDMLALINFYENIQTLLDKEGKTTKRLFGNYYGYKCNTSVTYSHYVIKVA